MLKFLISTFCTCLLVSAAIGDEEIDPIQKVAGKLVDASLISQRPNDGMIRDSKALKKLWTAWRPDEKLPEIDFGAQLVLVETAPGPNTVLTGDLILDVEGNLTFAVGSTRMAGPGFGYLVLVIPKQDIISINGNPIAPSPPTSPASETINIDMTGIIETDVVSNGSETSGTTISSNGIVWELDLQDTPELVQASRILNSTSARVKGTLSRTGETDVEFRWIVKVDSITYPGAQLPDQLSAQVDARNRMGAEHLKQARSDPNQNSSNQGIAGQRPTVSLNQTLNPPTRPAPIDLSKIKKSFRTIAIVTSGGPTNERQVLTINAKGEVTNEIKEKDILSSWTIAPEKLIKLHHFINQTDWGNIPRQSRSNEPGAFRYEISIESHTGLKRFMIDQPSLSDQPTINLLFRFFRKG